LLSINIKEKKDLLKPTCNFIFALSKLILQLKKDAPIVGLA